MSIKALKAGRRSFSGLSGQVPEHHVLLQEYTVGAGGTTSITFSNIDQSYQHLQIRGISQQNPYASVTNIYMLMRFNGSSGANYTTHVLDGGGTSAASAVIATSSNQLYMAEQIIVISSSNTFGAYVTDILDYANTSKNKTIKTLCGWDNNGSGMVSLISGFWNSTNAITSITILPNSTYSLSQYSTFALYGVK